MDDIVTRLTAALNKAVNAYAGLQGQLHAQSEQHQQRLSALEARIAAFEVAPEVTPNPNASDSISIRIGTQERDNQTAHLGRMLGEAEAAASQLREELRVQGIRLTQQLRAETENGIRLTRQLLDLNGGMCALIRPRPGTRLHHSDSRKHSVTLHHGLKSERRHYHWFDHVFDADASNDEVGCLTLHAHHPNHGTIPWCGGESSPLSKASLAHNDLSFYLHQAGRILERPFSSPRLFQA